MPKGRPRNPRPQKENSLAAIRAHQFKPGQSGNPSGKPKRAPVTEAYRLLMDVKVRPDIAKQLGLKKGATYADAVAFSVLASVLKGKHAAATELREAIEGRAPQRIELSGSPDNPAPIEIKTRQVDLSKLSTEELIAYKQILSKASGI